MSILSLFIRSAGGQVSAGNFSSGRFHSPSNIRESEGVSRMETKSFSATMM